MTGNDKTYMIAEKVGYAEPIISAMYLRNNMVCHLPSTKRTDWSRSEKNRETVEKIFESIVGAYGACIVLYDGSVVCSRHFWNDHV